MDQDFQTSFIPKKPIIEKRATASQPISLMTIIALFIFFTVLVGSGGLYFYKGILAGNLTKMENDLNLSKNRFEPEKIKQLQSLDKRLRSSSEILSKHISISPIFETLQDITMKTVRYTKFSYTIGAEQNAKIVIKMEGQAVGYRSIALQADLFTKNKNLIDPVFSNLKLDDKGNVNFDLAFSVSPDFVNYKKVLTGNSPTSTAPVINNTRSTN